MPHTLITELEGKSYLIISSEDLVSLLADADLIEEIDTSLNKSIRLLRYRDRLVLQEYSFEGDIIVRPMGTREAADAFVRSRLETYERMWDGCGCKINFYQ